MNIKISFKHLEHTPALDERIREKSEKFTKFFGGNFNVDWTCWCDDNKHHWAEVKIIGQPSDCFAKASAETLYMAIDDVVEKAERQLEKHKSKLRNRVHGTEPHKNLNNVEESEDLEEY
ncbi:MAG: ribosome-associated translation inhibitor RaiA [Bacteriovoracaceae bacterium]|nr:ribosome-associated translation inhibitor RaiA [Bacteriovoracaceae bacterium]